MVDIDKHYFMDDWIKEVLDKGEEQVKKELEDYWNLMGVHSKVLDMITNGKMSKTNYTFEAIEEVYNEELSHKQEKESENAKI